MFKVVALIPIQMSHGMSQCMEACAADQYEPMSSMHRANKARFFLHLGNKNPDQHWICLTLLQFLKVDQMIKTFKDYLAFHLLYNILLIRVKL